MDAGDGEIVWDGSDAERSRSATRPKYAKIPATFPRSQIHSSRMAGTDETKLFLRYRATGDSAALATVFDRVAPKLLLVAAHLSRDHAMAEDLVQTTFVAAMENADRFRSGQPLLPWLNGILLNRWRQERRKLENRQRHRSELETGELQTGDDSAPHSEAEAAELMAAVTEALEQLPQSYRSALNLRLVHGLEAVQIAHTLGLAPGTVRSQLRRGLDLLRRLLPRSLVLPSVVALLSGQGLAAVRARVLAMVAKRGASASVGTGAGTGANWLMKKWMAAVVLALLAVGVLALTWDGWMLASADAESAPGDATAKARLVENAGSTAESTDETRIADRRQKLPAAPDHVLRVVGRCVDGDSGAVLPGVRVRLERDLSAGEWEVAEKWRDPEAALSDVGGHFEIVLLTDHEAARGRYRLRLHTDPPRTQEIGFDDLRFGGSYRVEVGDVRMFRTVLLEGRIVDKAGQPLGGMQVRFHRVTKNPRSTQQSPRAFADDDGRFQIHLERGAWSPDTATISYASGETGAVNTVTPDAVDLTASARTTAVTLVSDPIGRRDRIAGRVIDSDGLPVVGSQVRFYGPEADRLKGYARTDAMGRFAGYVWQHWAEPDCLGVRARVFEKDRHNPRRGASSTQLLDPEAYYRWGSDDVRIVVDRTPGRRVPIVVRVAGEAKTVEEYGISVGKRKVPRVKPSAHPAGTGIVLGPRGGAQLLFRVYPRDRDLLPSAVFEVPRGSESPLEIRVGRRGMMAVRVVDSSGAPVVGSRVRLIQPHGFCVFPPSENAKSRSASADPETRILRGAVSRDRQVGTGRSTIGRLGLALGEGRTDDNGVVHLPGPVAVEDLILAALGPGHRPKVVRGVAFRKDQVPFDVVVQRGATVRGRIGPASLLAALRGNPFSRRSVRLRGGASVSPRVTLRGGIDGEDRWPPPLVGRRGIAIAADGTFAARGVPPGTWNLHLEYEPAALPFFKIIGVTRVKLGGPRPIAVLTDLRDGEERTIDIDVAHLMPARLEGRVLVGGQPLRNQAIHFFRVESREFGAGTSPMTLTDGAGRFVMPHLDPGEYAIWRQVRGVWRSKAWRLSFVPCVEYVKLAAGQTLARDFHSELGALLVRFRTPDGKPLANTYVNFILHQRTRWPGDKRSNAQGEVRFPSFPCGEIELQVWGKKNYRLEPARIRLRGTGDWEEYAVVAHPLTKSK